MSNEELKQALMNEREVIYKGIVYKCVNGIIYRKKSGKIDISAELMDKGNNSVSIADPRYIEYASE